MTQAQIDLQREVGKAVAALRAACGAVPVRVLLPDQVVERFEVGDDGGFESESISFIPLRDGEPCGHRGCLSHVTHPCDGCGRTQGRGSGRFGAGAF